MSGSASTGAIGAAAGGTGGALLLIAALSYQNEPTPMPVTAAALILLGARVIATRLAVGRATSRDGTGRGGAGAAELAGAALAIAAGGAAIATGRWEASATAGIAGAAFLCCQAQRFTAAASDLAPPQRRPLAMLTVSTALVEGTAALALFQLAAADYRHGVAVVMALLILVRLFLWLGCLKRLRGTALSETVLERLAGFNTAFVFFGNAVPAILVANSIFTPGLMHGMVAAAAAIALVAGWHLTVTLAAGVLSPTADRA